MKLENKRVVIAERETEDFRLSLKAVFFLGKEKYIEILGVLENKRICKKQCFPFRASEMEKAMLWYENQAQFFFGDAG